MGSHQQEAASERQHLVGRAADLLALRQFLDSGSPARCLVISGEAGIGKTTLWEAGVETAAAEGYLVLSTRSTQAEVELSFAALADLVDDVDPGVLAGLPSLQLQALEAALRRGEPLAAPPDPYAISAALLSTLRALEKRGPLLVAIDDVAWLDRSSADSLVFAARRLARGGTRFLVTRRSGRRSDLERAMQPDDLRHIEVAALSFGAMRDLVSERSGLTLTRHVLRQIHETTQGNPLFVLELCRLLAAQGVPELGAELPVPEVVDDIFDSRIRGLPAPERRALLAVALSGSLTRAELSALVDPLALEDAISSGLLVIERSHVHVAHPMLAVAARRHSSARERRDLHLELASAVGDATLRARHLAIATVAPDADVAGAIAAAAELAAKRGAVRDAQELGTHALRLTPRDAPGHTDRVLALARFHVRADDMPRVTELLTAEMSELPPGRARAIAHLVLGEAADVVGDQAHVEFALTEAPRDPEVRALALAKRSRFLTVGAVERIDRAETWALEAVSAAQHAGSDVGDRVRTALAWARILRGRPIDDLSPSQLLSDRPQSLPESSMDRMRAIRLVFRGELGDARMILRQLLALADERGDLQGSRIEQQLLCDLELRAGNLQEAGGLLNEISHDQPWTDKVQARLRAREAAVTGAPSDARRWAAAILDTGSGYVQGWDRLEARQAIGVAALFENALSRAVESLQAVWAHTLREQVDDPGAFPVAADLVEALVQSGDIDSAAGVTNRLRRSAVRQQHPWGLASARRCAAVVRLAGGYTDAAASALGQAAADYGALGLHFDRARTLLMLGVIQRRFQKRAGARQSLEDASAQFDECGCTGWATRARSELSRVSGRRSGAEGQLTPSERSVVELAARGMSNKEIASHLSVTVFTVEAHLSHTYAKLGIRSRSQLVRSFGGSAPE
jgi:DNA-binding CsgD family transcriptional regulator